MENNSSELADSTAAPYSSIGTDSSFTPPRGSSPFVEGSRRAADSPPSSMPGSRRDPPYLQADDIGGGEVDIGVANLACIRLHPRQLSGGPGPRPCLCCP